MPKRQDTRTLVEKFVAELTAVVHADALDVVRAALGVGAAPKRRGPGRPRKAAKRGPGRPPKARRGPGRPRKARRARRSSADLEATSAKVLAYVRSNAGQRLEEIGRGLRTATAGLKRPIQVLLADGKLRTEGQKRGTRYFAGGRSGPKRGAWKKAGRLKVVRKARRKVTRKTAKKARRKLSPEQRAALVERLAKARAAKRATA